MLVADVDLEAAVPASVARVVSPDERTFLIEVVAISAVPTCSTVDPTVGVARPVGVRDGPEASRLARKEQVSPEPAFSSGSRVPSTTRNELAVELEVASRDSQARSSSGLHGGSVGWKPQGGDTVCALDARRPIDVQGAAALNGEVRRIEPLVACALERHEIPDQNDISARSAGTTHSAHSS